MSSYPIETSARNLPDFGRKLIPRQLYWYYNGYEIWWYAWCFIDMFSPTFIVVLEAGVPPAHFWQMRLEKKNHFYTKICWKWDVPIFIQKPHILSKFKNFTSDSKIVKLSWKQISELKFLSAWWNWAYFCASFRKFWKYDPCLYQFLHWIRGHCYTRRLILQPISVACPKKDLCT